MPEETPTPPSAKTLIRAWQNLQTIKKQLIEMGLLNADATPQDVLAKLRKQIPPELLT